MLIAVFIIAVCLVLSAIIASILGTRIKKHQQVCIICGDPAVWVWQLDGQESMVCEWHNAQLQTQARKREAYIDNQQEGEGHGNDQERQ